jgi:nitrite reductase/ring-hydroxylating ferredoxin subunit
VFPRACEDVGPDRRSNGITFSKDEINIVCPWHGYEYNIATGQHQGNKKLRLRPIKVRIENGEVFVAVPERR